MTHPPSNFLKYRKTVFAPYILPIIPVGAKLRADSKVVPEQIGKIPGRYFPGNGEWSGFRAWSTNRTTSTALEHWQVWQSPTPDGCGVSIAIAIRTKIVLAVDIDADDEEVANDLELHVIMMMGHPGAIRRRHGSPRRVMFYAHNVRTMPVTKMRLEFKILATDQKAAIEILGDGQQVVLEGPHAKGAMHYWQNDVGLIEGLDALRRNQKTVDDFDALMLHLKGWIDTDDRFERVTMKLPSHGERGESIPISDLMSPHVADDKDMLARAIAAIDINSPKLASYDRWIDLFRAMKAACSGDDQFYAEHILPKMMEHPGNAAGGVEKMESHWHSFTSSSFGADHVYQTAAAFGFTEGLDNAQDIFANQPLPTVGDGPAAGADAGEVQQGDGGSGPPGGGNVPGPVPGGPLPFSYTDSAAADACAAAFSDQRKYSSDKGWVRLKNGVWAPDKSILHPIGEVCSAIGDPYRAQGPQQAQIDVMMKSTRKRQAVELVMRSHPSFYVEQEEFDADPWLLNTPGGIWDIRENSLREHGDLMRLQTSVTPDIAALFRGYEVACPRWMAYLDFIADGRPGVVEFLQRWGGQHFIGKVLGQYLLFIHGKSGTGKTVFVDVIIRLGGTYEKTVSGNFFIRTTEKRTFELYQLLGKRGVLADETPKGSTWDEMQILRMLNNSTLSAEGKGKDFVDFRNTAAVTITGNHRPSFVTHAEDSGIDRRLLVLTMNKKIAEHLSEDEEFAEHLVAEEGPAIMMWFMQGAQEGWQSFRDTKSYLGNLADPFKIMAAEYRRDANPFLQWISEEMQLDPTKELETRDAFALFKAYNLDQNPRWHMSKQDFKEGLEKATNGAVYFTRSGSKEKKGRWVFRGSTIGNDCGNDAKLIDPTGRVVTFPGQLK